MWVVKLGGSLSSGARLGAWLEAIARAASPQLLVVPGGGPFADTVRAAQARWRFGDATAHRMAQLGMSQYGLMLAALAPALRPAASVETCASLLARGQVPVWTPGLSATTELDLPSTWSVTSDSLAAGLAVRLRAAHLVLIKSVALERGSLEVDPLAQRGIVDAYFPEAMRAGAFASWIYTADEVEPFARALAAGVPDTRSLVSTSPQASRAAY